jgi:hypothetical protein
VAESRRPAGTTRVVCHYDAWRISVVPDSPASLPPRARSMGEVVTRVRRERRDAASQHGLEFGASVPSLMPGAWFGDSSVGMAEVRHGRCGVARFTGCRGCAAKQFLGVRMTELCGVTHPRCAPSACGSAGTSILPTRIAACRDAAVAFIRPRAATHATAGPTSRRHWSNGASSRSGEPHPVESIELDSDPRNTAGMANVAGSSVAAGMRRRRSKLGMPARSAVAARFQSSDVLGGRSRMTATLSKPP